MTQQELVDLAGYLSRKYYYNRNLEGCEGFAVGKSEENGELVLLVYTRSKDDIKRLEETLSGFSCPKVYNVIGTEILFKDDTNEEMLEKLTKHLPVVKENE